MAENRAQGGILDVIYFFAKNQTRIDTESWWTSCLYFSKAEKSLPLPRSSGAETDLPPTSYQAVSRQNAGFPSWTAPFQVARFPRSTRPAWSFSTRWTKSCRGHEETGRHREIRTQMIFSWGPPLEPSERHKLSAQGFKSTRGPMSGDPPG